MSGDIKRWQIINNFIKERSYTSYLEVGVQYGENYMRIVCNNKQGCDPYAHYKDKNIHLVASDKFFENCRRNDIKFDIIFIDGLHEKEQFERDVKNALVSLNKGGLIICHDCAPTEQKEALYPRVGKVGTRWNGNVYLGWIKLRTELDYLMYVINEDEGLGVVEPDKIGLNLPNGTPLPNWNDYINNREMYLNLVDYETP